MFPILRPRPGSAGWGDFCVWVRTFLRVEEGTGYVVYRPKGDGYFSDEAALNEWNSGFANQPVRVQRAGKAFAYIKVDGMAADWGSVRVALGLTSAADLDPNSLLPAPGSVSDADRVRYYGLDYCLVFEAITRKAEVRKLSQFLMAVERWTEKLEKRFGKKAAEIATQAVVAEIRAMKPWKKPRTRYRPVPETPPGIRPGPPLDVTGRVKAPRSLEKVLNRALTPEEIYDVPATDVKPRGWTLDF